MSLAGLEAQIPVRRQNQAAARQAQNPVVYPQASRREVWGP